MNIQDYKDSTELNPFIVHFTFELRSSSSSSKIYHWITTWQNHAHLYKPNKSVKILKGDGGVGTEFLINSVFMFIKNVETYKVTDLGFRSHPYPHLIIEKHSIGGIYKCWDKIILIDKANGTLMKFEMYSEIPKGIMRLLAPITKWLAYRAIKKGWLDTLKKIADL